VGAATADSGANAGSAMDVMLAKLKAVHERVMEG